MIISQVDICFDFFGRWLNMDFEKTVLNIRGSPLTAGEIEILQVNLGYRCNMACKHCHLGAGPARGEAMGGDIVEEVLKVLKGGGVSTLDITGGAPELNPFFRGLVEEAKDIGCRMVVQTNLTIFFEGGMGDLPAFYLRNGVEIVASLPHYLEREVDEMRGRGAFSKSIRALGKLNDLGYGDGSPDRKLKLIYNPAGISLAAPQKELEANYRRNLFDRFGIVFDSLYAYANMPIGRFRDRLMRDGNFDIYMRMLKKSFNPGTLDGLMCRRMVNVGWDGLLYDCDFNQAQGLNISGGRPSHIGHFDYSRLAGRSIAVGGHCFGCTAGQGST
jgi:radical SAM/Cys-rich protein